MDGLVGLDLDAPAVECAERRTVADRDYRGALEPLLHEPIQLRFGRFIERRCRFIEQEIIGRIKQRPGNGESLLLAAR